MTTDARAAAHRCGWFVCARNLGLAVVLLTASAGVAFAQSIASGAINGKVADDTGGALPGVTVNLTSPVLQVKQVTVVTDADGRYRFPDLPAGTYQARFELTGFRP